MAKILLFILFFASVASQSEQVYKCMVNGKVVFSDVKCPGDLVEIGELNEIESGEVDKVGDNKTIKNTNRPVYKYYDINTLQNKKALEAFKNVYVKKTTNKAFAYSEIGAFG